jgi:hypothetical protein
MMSIRDVSLFVKVMAHGHPLRSSGLLRFMQLNMPDAGWGATLSGAFGALWSVVRTALVLSGRRE